MGLFHSSECFFYRCGMVGKIINDCYPIDNASYLLPSLYPAEFTQTSSDIRQRPAEVVKNRRYCQSVEAVVFSGQRHGQLVGFSVVVNVEAGEIAVALHFLDDPVILAAKSISLNPAACFCRQLGNDCIVLMSNYQPVFRKKVYKFSKRCFYLRNIIENISMIKFN